MEKIESLSSEDIVAQNIEKLRQLFPSAFSEGRLIPEDLLALLGDYTEKDVEYYHMDWAGKTRARMEANKVSTGTLRPAPEESKHWEDTGNLFIEGDNLEVLKLLQKSYSNKVKMIYIDPPYNTGKDFVYKDNYHDNLKNYLELSGQADESGRKLSTNTESGGRYHSNWLNMMYPRLMLARNLLTEDGVIFISIDDNEQANLKKLCDEIYGEENFIGIIANTNNPKGRSDDRFIATAHEFIIVYAKIIESTAWYGFEPNEKIIKRYNKIDDNNRRFREIDLRKTGENDLREDRPNLFYYFYYNEKTNDFFPSDKKREVRDYIRIKPLRSDDKEGNWRWSIKTAENKIDKIFPKFMPARKIWGVMEKDFLDERSLIKPTSSWTFKDVNSERGSEALINLSFDKKLFSNPKPVGTIKRCCMLGMSKNELVLDFFAGSGTTAHAVMALNAEDGGIRKCISVQLPEPTDEKTEAHKAGYSNIAEISKERIRRAGELILTEEEEKKGKIKEKLEKMIRREVLEITESHSIDAARYQLPQGIIIDQAVEDLLEELNKADTRIRSLDTGFRVFKLDSSNLHSWDPDTNKFETQLDELLATGADHIKAGRTESDILYEILLKFGLELTVPILEKTLHGQTIYNIGFGTLYICLGENIHVDIARRIGEWQKEFPDSEPTVIFRDSGFPDDAAKTNTVQMLKQYGIDKVNSI